MLKQFQEEYWKAYRCTLPADSTQRVLTQDGGYIRPGDRLYLDLRDMKMRQEIDQTVSVDPVFRVYTPPRGNNRLLS